MKKPEPTFNVVHTYVKGATFQNIFGGVTQTNHAQITHIVYMSPMAKAKWPYLKNKWELSDSVGYIGCYKTLKEAKAAALGLWPNCYFFGPKERRKITAELGEWK